MSSHLQSLLSDVESSSSTLYRLLQPHWESIIHHLSPVQQSCLSGKWKYLSAWRTPHLFMLQLIINYLSIVDILKLYHLCKNWHSILQNCKWHSCEIALLDTPYYHGLATQLEYIFNSSIQSCIPRLNIPLNTVTEAFDGDTIMSQLVTIVYDELFPVSSLLCNVHTLIIETPIFSFEQIKSFQAFLMRLPQLTELQLRGGDAYGAEIFVTIQENLPKLQRITLDGTITKTITTNDYEYDREEFVSYPLQDLNVSFLYTPQNRWKQVELCARTLVQAQLCQLLRNQQDIEELSLKQEYLYLYGPDLVEEDWASICTFDTILPLIGQLKCVKTLILDEYILLPSLRPSLNLSYPTLWSSLFTAQLAATLCRLEMSSQAESQSFLPYVPVVFCHMHTLKVAIDTRESLLALVRCFPHVHHLTLTSSDPRQMLQFQMCDLLLLKQLTHLQQLQFHWHLLSNMNRDFLNQDMDQIQALELLTGTQQITAFFQTYCVAKNQQTIVQLSQTPRKYIWKISEEQLEIIRMCNIMNIIDNNDDQDD